MEIFWLILIVVVGMGLLKGVVHFEGWFEERQIQKSLREKYPSNHPFWKDR